MGAPFEFAKGEGPVVHEPVRTRAQIEALRVPDPAEGLGYVLEAIKMIRRELDGKTPLIGFAGRPSPSRATSSRAARARTSRARRTLMYREPARGTR
jgi:uroporphyrinogen decarboxylase